MLFFFSLWCGVKGFASRVSCSTNAGAKITCKLSARRRLSREVRGCRNRSLFKMHNIKTVEDNSACREYLVIQEALCCVSGLGVPASEFLCWFLNLNFFFESIHENCISITPPLPAPPKFMTSSVIIALPFHMYVCTSVYTTH